MKRCCSVLWWERIFSRKNILGKKYSMSIRWKIVSWSKKLETSFKTIAMKKRPSSCLTTFSVRTICSQFIKYFARTKEVCRQRIKIRMLKKEEKNKLSSNNSFSILFSSIFDGNSRKNKTREISERKTPELTQKPQNTIASGKTPEYTSPASSNKKLGCTFSLLRFQIMVKGQLRLRNHGYGEFSLGSNVFSNFTKTTNKKDIFNIKKKKSIASIFI